jgi:putative multiple sugar transport system substrate-binding protein
VKKRGIVALLAAGAIVASLSACAGGGSGSSGGGSSAGSNEGGGQLVGIAMPTQQSERWIQDGNDLQYAEDDIPTQISQIENMITKGAVALIVAAKDGSALTTVLEEAASQDIKVIAYDRLLVNTDAVSYYATFDNFLVGQQQAWSVLNGLGLTDLAGKATDGAPAGPFNIELFAGSSDDNNATFFFNGAMDVLQPYIDKGTLVVKSGQTDFNVVATQDWLGANAQARMEDLLTKSYSDGSKVNAVLSPYDGLSRGIASALKDNGYSVGAGWPIISGQDAEVLSVQYIETGEQYATIFKDTRDLAAQAVKMTVAVLNGEEPEVNNTTDYDNGVKVVPSYLLQPVTVVKDNITEALIDTGYWTQAEIDGAKAE